MNSVKTTNVGEMVRRREILEAVRHFEEELIKMNDILDEIRRLERDVDADLPVTEIYLCNKEAASDKSTKLDFAIQEMIKRLGIPAHIKGYRYLKRALKMVYYDDTLLEGITKRLYPDLAIEFKTTSSRVERAMRHAIEIAYSRGGTEFRDAVFGDTVDPEKARTTNSEFIAGVVNNIRVQMDSMA